MDCSHILNSSVLNVERLVEYGFVPFIADGSGTGTYTLKKYISGEDFYVLVTVSRETFDVKVFDGQTDERYALFDAPRAHGAFIGMLREKVQAIIEEIKENCFESTDIKARYVEHLIEGYDCSQDFPWNDEASVFRCRNGKWFALLMRIKFRNVGLPSEEKVWAVNLKQEPEEIPEIIDNRTIFPAYHMNKKYWITVLVSAATDYGHLLELTRKSYVLVESKR